MDGDFALFLMEQLDAEDGRIEFAIAQAACWPHAGDNGEGMATRYNRLLDRSRTAQWFVSEDLNDDEYYRSEWKKIIHLMSGEAGVKVERHQSFIRT